MSKGLIWYGTSITLRASRRQPVVRGKGIQRRVKSDTKIPGNWAAFLRVDEIKQELFHFLTDQLGTVYVELGQVISTKGKPILCNGRRDMSGLSSCNHKEADTRLLLHAADAGKCGFEKVMLQTVDTDVVVLAIATFHDLALSEIWIAFGVGKHLRYVPVHVIASSIGQQKSKALLAFHSFTGCDQTSSFASIGKKTACTWEAWAIYDEVAEVFQSLSTAPSISAVTEAVPVLEHYTGPADV